MDTGFSLEDGALSLALVTGLLRRMAEAEWEDLFIDPPEKVEAIYCLMRTTEMLTFAFLREQVARQRVNAATIGDLRGDAQAIETMFRDALARLGWTPENTTIAVAENVARPA